MGSPIVATFSIVARDPRNGDLGVAVLEPVQEFQQRPGQQHQPEHGPEAELKTRVVQVERVVDQHREDAEGQ